VREASFWEKGKKWPSHGEGCFRLAVGDPPKDFAGGGVAGAGWWDRGSGGGNASLVVFGALAGERGALENPIFPRKGDGVGGKGGEGGD